MIPNVDAPECKITPADISRAVGGFKFSDVSLEVFDDNNKWWDRYNSANIDSLMSLLFDFSLSYDIVGIQKYEFLHDRIICIHLKPSTGYSSNIDAEMMDAISRIEFDKGDKND